VTRTPTHPVSCAGSSGPLSAAKILQIFKVILFTPPPLGIKKSFQVHVNQRGGSEWEPIKILLEGDGDSNKTNTTFNTRLRLTTQVGQGHVATGVLQNLGNNKQPSDPKLTNTHNRNLHGLLHVLHRSDRWPVPVRLVTTIRPVDRAGQAGVYSSRTKIVLESLTT
jgi:hypothetical protein